MEDIHFIFEVYNLSDKLRERFKTIDQMTDEQIDSFFDQMKSEGHPNMKMNRNGNVVSIINRFNEQVFDFDLDEGARITSGTGYTANHSLWKSDYQRVGSFWVPKSIYEEITYPNGQHIVKKMNWVDQQINKTTNEKDFT